jgi:alkanesulfonate monooxygenase SsuD/methylene tetrahydromethanopterin reductase-like flavin-dependent oxidoreductase (luciferase family)
MPGEFGLFYEIPVPRPWHERSEYDAYHDVIAQAVRGEEMGFSHFWTVEHHFLSEFSHCSAPEVLYGAIAAKTSRMKIGHGVRLLPFPYNHPLRVAEMAGALDIICDGRLEFGTGRSSTRDELEGFGIDPLETRDLWQEALEMVVGAWTNDVFEWNGRAGLGLLSFTIGVPPSELAVRIGLYRDGLKQAKPIGKFVNSRAATFTMVHCAETNAEARRNAEASVLWYFKRSIQLIAGLAAWQEGKELGSYEYTRALKDLNLESFSYDLLDDMEAIIVGDPDTCIRRARNYFDTGCDQILCLMQPHGIAPDKVMRSIELFGEHVIPAFR